MRMCPIPNDHIPCPSNSYFWIILSIWYGAYLHFLIGLSIISDKSFKEYDRNYTPTYIKIVCTLLLSGEIVFN